SASRGSAVRWGWQTAWKTTRQQLGETSTTTWIVPRADRPTSSWGDPSPVRDYTRWDRRRAGAADGATALFRKLRPDAGQLYSACGQIHGRQRRPRRYECR